MGLLLDDKTKYFSFSSHARRLGMKLHIRDSVRAKF